MPFWVGTLWLRRPEFLRLRQGGGHRLDTSPPRAAGFFLFPHVNVPARGGGEADGGFAESRFVSFARSVGRGAGVSCLSVRCFLPPLFSFFLRLAFP